MPPTGSKSDPKWGPRGFVDPETAKAGITAAFHRLKTAIAEAQWPDVVESQSYGTPALKVQKKLLVRVKDGDTLVFLCPLDEKERLLKCESKIYFETDHYKGYPAILVRLSTASDDELRVALERAWRMQAPKRIVKVAAKASPESANPMKSTKVPKPPKVSNPSKPTKSPKPAKSAKTSKTPPPAKSAKSAQPSATAPIPTPTSSMSPDDFRRLALSFPEAVEKAHMNHPDFRVGGKIFATLGYPDATRAMVKLPPEEQAGYVAAYPDVFVPVPGAWGRQGCTSVHLSAASEAILRPALEAAWRRVAPKT